MPKKTSSEKVVYRIPPFVVFLIVVLCAVCLYIVLYQEFLIEQMALTFRIEIMKTTPNIAPVVSVTPTLDKMRLGY